ncbi:hypothetical protein CRG98_016889 [Punica granatum]|uniref:Uncharacterized protein n=1 Tax=Punica granatum TaxID=22663 RepID=A0A2I0K2D1_PUNGR|nr:hypothetical protein CRG98_016889 [Punica granatum]
MKKMVIHTTADKYRNVRLDSLKNKRKVIDWYASEVVRERMSLRRTIEDMRLDALLGASSPLQNRTMCYDRRDVSLSEES